MRRIATTLLVTAITTAGAALAPAASAQLPPALDETLRRPVTQLQQTVEKSVRQPVAQLQQGVDETLRQLPVDPPELPLPEVPELPLPELLPQDVLPEVPAPAPVPTPVPLPVPAPAPSEPDLPPAAGGSQPPAGGSAAGSTSGGQAGGAPSATTPAPARSGDRAAPRRSSRGTDTAAAGGGRERAGGAERPADGDERRGAAGRPAEDTEPPTASTRPAAARVAAPAAAEPPSMPARIAEEVADLVRALPPAILWALIGVGLLALVLAINALWQWRRHAALEAQRAELLDDIGVLSRALLPPVPGELDGLAVSAAYRPADGPAAGGDFYDVFVIDERRVCVLVGDVSGHGRESVTQAALARYTLRTLLADGHSPGEALARADALLTRDLRPNFVTVIAGVYDPATGELTYAKAGHAPPIVLGAAHDPAAEQPATPLGLGLGLGDGWPEFRVRVGDGVSVCLFTDGLEDARVGDGRVGRDAVARLLAAQEIPEAGRLLSDLEELANTMCDDTAAIVLSRR
jgi:serine phosphatase RsbU (regulator of sigma subunit)